ncbi:MAG: hypothetical protein V2I63_08365 [Pseudomonadales bacterium]|jgi:hypothetical protein|nr:hypothetical protein [Pseudomonadales bacterium]
MRIVNGIAAIVLFGLMLLHLGRPQAPLWIAAFALGGMHALMACRAPSRPWLLRLLAVSATATLFLYFGGFLSRAPHLGDHWYLTDARGHTLMLLVAAFCMMPVVAAFTCRMKEAGEIL